MPNALQTCECGGKYLKTTRGQTHCPDCEELMDPGIPDVLDMMEDTRYGRKRNRDAARTLDNFGEDS